MMEQLTYYINRFERLKRDHKNGGAPHKPILLISIIDLYTTGILHNHRIGVLPELVAAFRSNWSSLVTTRHDPIFALPFYHMQSEPFWNLIAKPGCELWIKNKVPMRSFRNLNMAVDCAVIDDELTQLLLNEKSREILRMCLLEQYFPDSINNYHNYKPDEKESAILYDSSEEYKQKINALRKVLDENAYQEEIFVRSGIFKREIPKLYKNTCAISGWRVDAVEAISMIDACHIVPFSEGYDDSLGNGIALSPNLHRAFDRGLLSISDNYRVMVKNNFIESDSAFSIKQFEGIEINLPLKEEHYPDLNNLAKHREKYGYDV